MAERPRYALVLCESGSYLEATFAQLQVEACEFTYVNSPFAAVRQLLQGSFDIAILQLKALHDRELEVIQLVKSLCPSVRVYATLGLGEREKAAKAIQFGADAYLLEPFYPAELTSLIQRTSAPALPASPEEAQHVQPHPILKEFAARMADEVNNPLTTLYGWLQLLISDTPKADAHHETLLAMQEEVHRLATNVKRLQASAGAGLIREHVNVNELLAELVSCYDNDNGREAIVSNLAADTSMVFADRRQLKEACGGLLASAVRAAGKEGRVKIVSSVVDSSWLELQFTNNGKGPTPAEPPELLSQEPRSRRGSPMGLAEVVRNGQPFVELAVARDIVESHGGFVNVDLRGSGTTVTVSLPITSDTERGSTRHDEEQNPGG